MEPFGENNFGRETEKLGEDLVEENSSLPKSPDNATSSHFRKRFNKYVLFYCVDIWCDINSQCVQFHSYNNTD